MLSPAYKRYALAAMTTIYTVNLFDRGLMLLLLQPIKVDLHLSDTQMGFVTGIAFGVFYATLGVPIARWADRGNRVTITAVAIGLWGLTSMACVFVTNYLQLLLARVAAGVGDSGCQPPMYSLLGDYFPQPLERTHAMYIWTMSGPLSALISFVAAGWLNERYGWRLTFLLMGALGLALSIVAKLTLVEPRAAVPLQRAQQGPQLTVKDVVAILWHQRTCRHLTLATILMFTVGQGVVTWQSVFMIRHHGVGTAELGVWMGLIMGLGGVVSLLLGKFVIRRWFTGNERGQMRLAGICVAATTPIFVAFIMVPRKEQAFIALLLQMVVITAFSAPVYVLLQRLVPDSIRATVLMVMLLLANLIGLGVGPLLVGVLSDLLQATQGGDALRTAMLSMSLLWMWAGYHLLHASRTIGSDLSKVALCTTT